MNSAVSINKLSFTYPAQDKQPPRQALKQVSFEVKPGEIFGVLGPNGGGKSTLFKILSTALPFDSGTVSILGLDLATQARQIRKRLGVVFQNPSLDGKLTIRENMMHQGHLYGLRGKTLSKLLDEMLERYGLASRGKDFAASLSGGLKRRVELAKSLLHQPDIILLDEPSTGLDPSARQELWRHLKEIKSQRDVTILLTTHYMDEAEHCERLVLLDEGNLVAQGSPKDLKAEIGGDVITIGSDEPEKLKELLQQRFSLKASSLDGSVRFEREQGHSFIPQLVEAFPGLVRSVNLSKPSLEDVFLHHAGHRFWRRSDKDSAAERP